MNLKDNKSLIFALVMFKHGWTPETLTGFQNENIYANAQFAKENGLIDHNYDLTPAGEELIKDVKFKPAKPKIEKVRVEQEENELRDIVELSEDFGEDEGDDFSGFEELNEDDREDRED